VILTCTTFKIQLYILSNTLYKCITLKETYNPYKFIDFWSHKGVGWIVLEHDIQKGRTCAKMLKKKDEVEKKMWSLHTNSSNDHSKINLKAFLNFSKKYFISFSFFVLNATILMYTLACCYTPFRIHHHQCKTNFYMCQKYC